MSDRRSRFLELVRENRGRLRRICRVYAGSRADEDDLFQEILLEAWRSLPSFEGRASPDTWLYRVALNTALSHERKLEVRREARLDDDDQPRGSDFPRPDRETARRDRLERLYAAIDELDETDRALVLLYLEDRSYREMSEVLGISESYVGVKLHRVKKELSKKLGGAMNTADEGGRG